MQRENHPNGNGKHDERSIQLDTNLRRFYQKAKKKGWRDLWEKDPSWFLPRHRKVPKSAKVIQKSKYVNRSEIYQIKSDAGPTNCSTEETRQRKQPAQAYAGR